MGKKKAKSGKNSGAAAEPELKEDSTTAVEPQVDAAEAVPEPQVAPEESPEPEPKPKAASPDAPQVAPEALAASPTSSNSALHQKIGKLSAQLEATETERDEIQDQYEELLDKVGHIKATLGERLKKDAAELTKIRAELKSKEDQVTALSEELAQLRTQLAEQQASCDEAQKKIGPLEQKLSYAQLQLESNSTQQKQVESQIQQLKDDVAEQTRYAEHYRTSMLEAAKVAAAKDDEQKKELEASRAEVATLKAELEALNRANAGHSSTISDLEAQLKTSSGASAQATQLEETVREKNILIGKLRHEAVILNEHLTNALRIVKKDAEGQTVDKELVSNLIVQFVQLPRGDTKKFEVLQLISNFLGWDEDRQVEVGLARGGGVRPANSLGGFLGKFAEFMERESRKPA